MLSVYHMTAFTIGFVMDLLFGDPYWLPHPIRWIGRLIGWLDRKLLGETDGAVRNEAAEKKKGRWLVAFVLLPVLFFAAAVLFAAYRIHPAAGAGMLIPVPLKNLHRILLVKFVSKETAG